MSHVALVEAVDDENGRNKMRIVFNDYEARVYIETVGNHDGVVVCTKVRMSRAAFASLVRRLGVMS